MFQRLALELILVYTTPSNKQREFKNDLKHKEKKGDGKD